MYRPIQVVYSKHYPVSSCIELEKNVASGYLLFWLWSQDTVAYELFQPPFYHFHDHHHCESQDMHCHAIKIMMVFKYVLCSPVILC